MEEKVKNITDSLKNNQKLRTFVYAVIAVTAVLLLVITAAQKLGNVTVNTMTANVKAYFMSMGSGDGFPYELDAKSVREMKVRDSGFLMLFDNKTMLLTSTAKEIMPKEHKFVNPVMKTNGSHVIVYDLDSDRYRVQNSTEIINEEYTENRIMSGAVGKKGNFALGFYGTDSQSELSVYSPSTSKVFSYKFKAEHISDITLSDNGKYAAVSTVYSKEGKISSRVYVFNISSEKKENCFDYDSSMILHVNYVKGDNISVTGDNIRSYIKNGKTRTDDMKFGSDSLHNYTVSADGRAALVLSRYGSSSLSGLYVYSAGNKEQFCVDLEKEVKWVDCDEKYTAVLFENEVRTYNKRGKQVGSIEFAGEPLRVCVDGKKTYVLTSASLQCFDTKGTQKAEV